MSLTKYLAKWIIGGVVLSLIVSVAFAAILLNSSSCINGSTCSDFWRYFVDMFVFSLPLGIVLGAVLGLILKKKFFGVIVVCILGLSIFIFVFYLVNGDCVSEGGYSSYFEEKYLKSELKYSGISDEYVVASVQSESSCRSSSGEYLVREGGNLKKVERKTFADFLERYDADCSACLIQEVVRSGVRYYIKPSDESKRHLCLDDMQNKDAYCDYEVQYNVNY